EGVGGDRLDAHPCREAGGGGGQVAPVADHHRVGEVVVQVVDVLDDPVVAGTGDGEVVEHRQVLHEFAQAHAAGVRADRDAELGGEQQDRQVLVDPADPGGVQLE